MAACEHGDIGLGAGSSSEMEQLKVFSNEKRKQRDFRTGAGPMAIGLVLPTTNATSLVVVAVVAAAANARQVITETAIETATATSGVADIEEATGASLPASTATKRQGTQVHKEGQEVNPNYKGDLADYKPNFRPGQKSKSVPRWG
jgi:hypothetical protein